MTDKELEQKKDLQYQHLKENVNKVFGRDSDEFISSVLGMVLKSISYSDLHLEQTKRILKTSIDKTLKEKNK